MLGRGFSRQRLTKPKVREPWQGVHRLPAGNTEDFRCDQGELDAGVLQELLDPVPIRSLGPRQATGNGSDPVTAGSAAVA